MVIPENEFNRAVEWDYKEIKKVLAGVDDEQRLNAAQEKVRQEAKS